MLVKMWKAVQRHTDGFYSTMTSFRWKEGWNRAKRRGVRVKVRTRPARFGDELNVGFFHVSTHKRRCLERWCQFYYGSRGVIPVWVYADEIVAVGSGEVAVSRVKWSGRGFTCR